MIAPAYNEETLIVQSAKAFLASDYAPLEVIVANDGSRDETFARLEEAFDLVPLPLRGSTALPTQPIRGVYISRVDPRLRVVDKANGGRSDAINAGIRSDLGSSRRAAFSATPAPNIADTVPIVLASGAEIDCVTVARYRGNPAPCVLEIVRSTHREIDRNYGPASSDRDA